MPVEYEFAEQPNKRAPVVAAAARLDTADRLRKRIDVLEKGHRSPRPSARCTSSCGPGLRTCRPRASVPVIQEEIQGSALLALAARFCLSILPRRLSVLALRRDTGRAHHGGLPLRWMGSRCRRAIRGGLALFPAALALQSTRHRGGSQRRRPGQKRRSPGGVRGRGDFGTLIEDWEPRPGDYPADLWAVYAESQGHHAPPHHPGGHMVAKS